jgi:hypothetical protein
MACLLQGGAQAPATRQQGQARGGKQVAAQNKKKQ